MTEDRPRIHPSITAALDRDGISLARVAELVGLDLRTLKDVRLDSEAEKRAARYRRLDAWIEGRTRAVQGEPDEDGKRWRLEELGQDVTPADVAGVADRLLQRAEEAEALAAQLRVEAGKLRGNLTAVSPDERKRIVNDKYSSLPPLTAETARVLLGAMNAQLLQSVAVSVKARSKGQMVIYNQKVPPDFQERLERAAKKVGLTAADYLRALVELHSEAVE